LKKTLQNTLITFQRFISSFSIENDEQRRIANIRFFCFATLPFSVFFASYQLLNDHYITALSGFFATLIFLVLPYLLKKRIFDSDICAYIFILAGGQFVFFSSKVTGGIISPVLNWMLYLPMLPVFLAKRKLSLLWLIAALGSVLFFYVQALTVGSTPNIYDGISFYHFSFFVVSGLIVLVFMLFYISENNKNRLLLLLEQKNKELSETQKELIAAQQYREKLLANVSHELRTPINAIMGFAEIIGSEKRNNEDDKLLNGIQASSQMLLHLLNDLLDLSKLRVGKLKLKQTVFSLAQMFQDIEMLFLRDMNLKEIKFKVEVASNLPEYVEGDAGRLQQILINLIGNALKFTPKGSIELLVQQQSQTEKTIWLLFSVKDTGIGISKDLTDEIFEAFKQVDDNKARRFGGAGLGLSIAKEFTELMGGKIQVQSELGSGSVFSVLLPFTIAEKPLLATAKNESKEILQLLSGKKILAAEDSELNRIVLQKLLKLSVPDLQLHFAHNGIKAISMAQKEYFDLVLMDLQMPECDGLEATKILRREGYKQPIIALTANALESEADECLANGMNAYITKPYNKEELLQTMFTQIQNGLVADTK
jgi:signal transduction histidine kinase/CheY-like chemotaxis protein